VALFVVLIAVSVVGVFARLFIFDVVKVRQCSMVPTLVEGDIAIAIRVFGVPPRCRLTGRFVVPGDVVLCAAASSRRITVKRIAHINANGTVVLLGDNAATSVDSREYGPVPCARISARVLVAVTPLGVTIRRIDSVRR
jgi:signal peptidase I